MENNPIENVTGFDALYDSMHKCRKGVLWKDSVASFYLNGVERTMKLSEELHSGTYKARKPVKFMITSPKPREIASITFRDRVYQRSLNDNAVYPIMSKSFIYDNFACLYCSLVISPPYTLMVMPYSSSSTCNRSLTFT